tara:strand:- start:168 stop:473 length:306 start_codon:yes stop_codon:yes gene_type:complete
MKISEFTDNSHIDELDAADVGNAAGKATRAVGTGVKKAAGAVGSGIKNFAKGFASGVKGTTTTPGKTPGSNVMAIQQAIAKLNPKQQASIRQLAAKQAGVK